MLDLLMMLCAGLLVVLLSPVMLFVIYMGGMFFFAPLMLFVLYTAIGFPWYVARKLIRFLRKPSRSPK